MKKFFNPYPFFIIVDDGGFDYATGKEKTGRIGMDAYENIVCLAREFKTRIPICFTAKFLDKENISGIGAPLEYVSELTNFLKSNSDAVEIGYHGLSHEHDGEAGEFFRLGSDDRVLVSEQRDHIQKSAAIFEYWGFRFPKLFVPPYHAWERGVTDKLLASFGVRYLVSCSKIKYGGRKYHWPGSRYLEFLPRAGMGIYGNDYDIDLRAKRKIKFYPERNIAGFAKDHIIPQKFFARLRLSKSLVCRPAHSYMAHIGNFSGKSLDFWREIFSFARNHDNIVICRDCDQAAVMYRNLKKNDRSHKNLERYV